VKGLFRRAATAIANRFRPPIASSTGAKAAHVPTAAEVRRLRSTASRADLLGAAYRRAINSRVIPPFKFCHGRTMVARHRAPIQWRTVG
jgi:hypothetical protein